MEILLLFIQYLNFQVIDMKTLYFHVNDLKISFYLLCKKIVMDNLHVT